MANLSFIGLGTMGGKMVQRLLNAGHTVTGYNRTKARADWLLAKSMLWGDSPRAVTEAADVILSMVSNTQALEAITGGPDGVLAGLQQSRPGKVYIDMSTVSPAASRALSQKVAEYRAKMLDAPVSGSAVTLEAGQLSVMVGGDYTVYEAMKPILQDIGPTMDYVGENGLAATMKVAVNLSLPIQILSFCESLLLAEKSGIPREAAMTALLNSVVASPALKYRFPLAVNPPDEPLFDVTMIQKDLILALDMGRELAVPLPTSATTNEYLNVARAQGLADQDFVVLYQVLRKMAGL